MRTETVKLFFYTYDELSQQAKEKARQCVVDRYHEASWYYEMKKEDLHCLFPSSKMDLQFSLSYCQGDGLNIYGKLDYSDIADTALVKAAEYVQKRLHLSGADEYKMLSHLTRLSDFYSRERAEIKLADNRRYCYSVTSYDDVSTEMIDWTFAYWVTIDKKTQDATDILAKGVKQAIEELENQWKEEGYTFLYEIDDDELEELCSEYELEFTSDGHLC